MVNVGLLPQSTSAISAFITHLLSISKLQQLQQHVTMIAGIIFSSDDNVDRNTQEVMIDATGCSGGGGRRMNAVAVAIAIAIGIGIGIGIAIDLMSESCYSVVRRRSRRYWGRIRRRIMWWQRSRPEVYLVEHECFKAPRRWRISHAAFAEHAALHGVSDSAREFQAKVIEQTGLSERTSLPPSYHYIPCRSGMGEARAESALTFFAMLDSMFARAAAWLDPAADIGIVVVNCCLFYPTPSLASMIVNRYKLRPDVKAFNLAGMGCAASLLAVDMAKHLLWAAASEESTDSPTNNNNNIALIVSSENMSGRGYLGAKRSMLVANCLFRSGGSAVLLSARECDRARAKYRLLHTVRTNAAADDRAFSCIVHREDEEGHVGVELSKELMAVAGRAIAANLAAMAPLVLPISELAGYGLRYLLLHLRRYFFFAFSIDNKVPTKPNINDNKAENDSGSFATTTTTTTTTTPDFNKAFDHFCLHAGGKAVIEELQARLRLPPRSADASFMTLRWFGNTSSTSVWYELAFLEATRRVRRRHRVWQLALGSGFKCFSAVWEATSDPLPCSASNPWRDFLDYGHDLAAAAD